MEAEGSRGYAGLRLWWVWVPRRPGRGCGEGQVELTSPERPGDSSGRAGAQVVRLGKDSWDCGGLGGHPSLDTSLIPHTRPAMGVLPTLSVWDGARGGLRKPLLLFFLLLEATPSDAQRLLPDLHSNHSWWCCGPM